MGTITVSMLVLKICAAGGLVVALSSALGAYHTYEFKLKKKGGKRDGNDGESFRERARSID